MNDFVTLQYVYEQARRGKRGGFTCLQSTYCYTPPFVIKDRKDK